ncbi:MULTISPECIES: glycosyltransferase family 2 protein [unclassified Coleofasciculus]|uniref:glycosyltransferase family 2 protein n=1 Tax=unclassified Coleofasciculus TaxID=2692782 RepID=UPI0018830B0D|nr:MULTISPECIES: glycosyltransferase family 2 protein [unclassified Coleofasciculus]MBE9126898.1 glycosyltransferase family 2 protein [Coleofasciculus sp. LEGE 07081]MBE9150206.1 glycosyltransferase family 2 protein [Coleofasciculus sp. LEGE 07092]
MTRDHTAVLMTCYNRKPNTLACLAALFNQILPPEASFDVYLVDDGSTDSTTEAVQQAYPQVKILQGDGNLYWNQGMRKAFSEAMKSDYHYYLWLNDDTLLNPEGLGTLLTTSSQLAQQGYPAAIVTGSTCDSQTKALTYGGMVRASRWRPLKFQLIEPGEEAKHCDTLNGNCVLIPREVALVVGNLDPAFTHYLGDFDYGLRAQQQGCTVWVAPGYIGTCPPNLRQESRTEESARLQKLLKKIDQPKGLSIKEEVLYSFEEWKHFAQRHGGSLWLIYCLLPYRRLLWSTLFSRFQGNRT